jgi:ligand-binding sensor domain-containing protein
VSIYWHDARQGNPVAQFSLGIIYTVGVGVPRDPTAAIKWYRLAAEQGAVDAQINLGFMFDIGNGVPIDHNEAVKWYRMAAIKGDSTAQANLGFMYKEARGVEGSDAQAVAWFSKSAAQQDPSGQSGLGEMLMEGRGIAKDEAAAVQLLQAAAAQGNARAQSALGEMLAAAQTWEWHTANGLGGTPGGLAFDASGEKWMIIGFGGDGSGGSLGHFDGKKWTLYTPQNTNGGLPDAKLESVAIDREGNKWVGSEKGVSKFDGKQWTRYTPESTGGGLPAGTVMDIVQDRKGNLWFGVADSNPLHAGVARFDGRNWTKWTAGNSNMRWMMNLNTLTVDRDDNIWVAALGDVYMFNGTRWTHFDKHNTSAFNGAYALTVDTKGPVWIAGHGVITRYSNGHWTSIPGPYTARDPRLGVPSSIAVDGDGNIWVAMRPTDDPVSLPGLFKYDGNRWTRFILGRSWRHINKLFIDPLGKLWVPTSGLVEFDGTVRTHYTGDNTLTGVPWGNAEALAVDPQGNVWAGTSDAAGSYDGHQWQLHRPTASLGEEMGITQVATALSNTTWFATWNILSKEATLIRKIGSTWTTWTQSDVGAPLGTVNGIAVDSKARLWAATNSGAFMFDGARWTHYTTQNTNGGLLSNTVRGIAIDAKNQVWFGTAVANPLGGGNEGGASRFDGSTWTNWTASSTSGGLNTNNIHAMQFDKKGRLWAVVGASKALRKLGGLAMFDGTRWQTLTAAFNSPYLEHNIRRISADNKGGIWLTTDKGAVHFDGEIKWQYFNRANTKNALTNPHDDTEILDIAVDKADNVWMSVKKGGLAVLKAPGTIARSTAQPEPLRVRPQLATFADLPEIAAAKAAVAKQKAVLSQ